MRRHREIRILSWLLLVCACVLFAVPADAAPRNRAPASLIPKELKGTDIRNDYMTTGTKQVGFIQTVVGHVIVANEGLNRAYYAASGDRLYEKDVIFTLKDSRCRFKVSGEDVVTMAQNTQIGIKTFNENARTQTKQSLFSMAKGKAMFYAMRLFRHRNASMQVETPTAVSGVRGTKWGVEVVELPGGKPLASLPIQVADTSDLGFRLLATNLPHAVPSFGPPLPIFQTTILCFSGTVFTGSTALPPPGAPLPPVITLSQGQMTTVGSGALPVPASLAPPGLVNSFLADTNVPGGGTPPPGPFSPGGNPLGPLGPPGPPDTSGLIQQQNSAGASRPTTHEGFFSVMLREGAITYDSHFMSPTTMDFSSATIAGSDPFVPGAAMTADGTGSYTDPTIKTLIPRDATPLDTGVPVTVSHTELGYNAYTEWGYWTQTQAMSCAGTSYYFIDKGYYVMGDLTTDAQIAALKASGVVGNYTGTAYGTHFDGSTATDMTGTFSTTINFATSAISGFNVIVSGGGQSASIKNASGTLVGNKFIGITGTAAISTEFSTASSKAYGAVYGSSGQAVGGNWGIKGGTASAYATGVFQGTR